MSDRGEDRHRRSRDHILPVEWGGRNTIAGDTRNIVVICQACNGRRASCLHCWALAACIQAVATVTHRPFMQIYREWHVGRVLAGARDLPETQRRQDEARARLLESRESHIRRARNALRVQAALAVQRIGLDEFVYPAESAAAKVWNRVTLRKRYAGPIED